MLSLLTPRLELLAATPEIALAEARGEPWHLALDAHAPAAWPPPLNDAASLGWFARSVARDPGGEGWYTWYACLRERQRGRRVVAGNCGFKGRPDAGGSVEIGYSLLPDWQGRGLGTELVAGLAAWAFHHPEVERIMAETYPLLVASVRVLEKNGFSLVGRGSLPDSIRFELRRGVFTARRPPDSRALRSAAPRS